jgi:hypothetical protein
LHLLKSKNSSQSFNNLAPLISNIDDKEKTDKNSYSDLIDRIVQNSRLKELKSAVKQI